MLKRNAQNHNTCTGLKLQDGVHNLVRDEKELNARDLVPRALGVCSKAADGGKFCIASCKSLVRMRLGQPCQLW
jgi:hypothetical protein